MNGRMKRGFLLWGALFLVLMGSKSGSAAGVGADLTVCGVVQSYTAATALVPGLLTIDGQPFVISAGTTLSNADLLTAGAHVCVQAALNASGQITSPASVSVDVSTALSVCGVVSQYTAATALLPGSITIGGQTFPIAAGTNISNADLITSGANICLAATLNGAGQIVLPSSVSANATTNVTICGVVSAYTAATATASGSITIGGQTLPIAAGTNISNANLITVGANLCLAAALNGAGQIVLPSSVSANATTTVTICGVVSAYTAATASAPGSITIDGQHLAIAAGTGIDGSNLITIGADLCLQATLNGAGQITPPSSVTADVQGSVSVCGTVSAFTAATATAPGSITIDGQTFAISAGTQLDGSGLIHVGADLCLVATLDVSGEIDGGSVAPAGESADLSITKSATPNPVAAGQALTYTLTVTNHGPDSANGIVVTDTLPAGVTLVSVTASQGSCSGNPTVVCHPGILGPGAVATVRIVVTAGAPGSVSNSASVTASTPDPNAGNNTSTTVQTTITGSASGDAADLRIAKTASPDPLVAGNTLTYTLTVHNNGPNAATGVVVTDTLPPGAAFVSASPDQGSCSGTSTVTCPLGDVATGATVRIHIVVTPGAPGIFTNSASVVSAVFDANTANNTASVTSVVLGSHGGGGGESCATKEILFPGVGEVIGHNNAPFKTASRILNFATTDETIFAEWFPSSPGGASGPTTIASMTIPAGSVQVLDETITSLFSTQGLGSIRLLFTGSIAADVRIYNDQRQNPDIHGIYASFAKGNVPADVISDGALLLMAQTPDDPFEFRTNLGYWNASPNTATLTLNAYRTDGTLLGTRTLSVPGWGNDLERVFDVIDTVPADQQVQEDFYVTFHVTGGRVLVYGAVTNNSTNDGIYVVPWNLDPNAGCP
jgi:uncharacterized repeat protein (TIGR01451 family)